MNLTQVLILPLLAGSMLLTAGCASVDERYKDYDPSRRYLKTEAYFSDPISVPPSLSSNRLEEYYPVPGLVPGKLAVDKSDKPALAPPSNTIKGA